jgi:hypothetical protein
MKDIDKQLILEMIRVQLEDYKTQADDLFPKLNLFFKDETDRFKNISRISLQRYYSGLISISSLIDRFKFYDPIEMIYALILRTLLLDFITVEFLYRNLQIGKDEFSKCLEGINYLSADDFNRYYNELNVNIKGFKNFLFGDVFPENFVKDDVTGNYKLRKTKAISAWKMAEFFKNKNEAYAYDAYTIFSNYSLIAHLNNATPIIMRLSNPANIKNLLWSMFYIFHGHDRCFEILDFFPGEAYNIVKKRDYFLKLINEI